MIIFKSHLTTFEVSSIFDGVAWAVVKIGSNQTDKQSLSLSKSLIHSVRFSTKVFSC